MSFVNPGDLLHAGLLVLAQSLGGSFGGAIIAASVALRVMMLPLTVPATRRRLVRERHMRVLQPAIAALNARHAGDPAKAMAETQKLYAKHGLTLFDRRSVIDGLVQWPPAAAVYSAIGKGVSGGFLWMANLVTPDRGLATLAALIAACIASLSVTAGDGPQLSRWMPVIVSSALAFLILSHLSPAVALYSITNSVVSGIEQVLVRRTLGSKAL